MIDFVIAILAYLVIIAQGASIVTIIAWILSPRFVWAQKWVSWVKKNALNLGFGLIFTAVLGSMFLSDIAQLGPCKLCWYQRIFIFPQFFIMAIALWNKDRKIYRYILPLSIFGLSIGIYHYVIQHLPGTITCAAIGLDCTTRYIYEHGFITISMMSITATATMTLLMLILWKAKKK